MNFGKTASRFGRSTALSALFCCIFALAGAAQETWSLQKCIEYARDNSLSLKQAQYGVELAKLSDKQNRLARLPNVSSSAATGMQFGRTIDPTTNSFDNQRISFNSFGVDVGWTAYAGGRIRNAIKQGKLDVDASVADAQFAYNTAAVGIANAYLQILMAQEQLENARKRSDLSTRQLDNTDKLIAAGTLPANDRLDVLAQIARDEQAIIQAQNLIEISYLTLKDWMQVDPNIDFKIERPTVVIPADANPDAVPFGATYQTALGSQPQIRADELRLQSAEIGVDIARAGLLPTLTLFGGLSTNWSSASKVFTPADSMLEEQTIYIDNTPVTVGTFVTTYNISDTPYFDQLDQNFGQNVGASLRVPIFNNGINSIGVERAQVAILNARVQSEQTKQQLKTDVQTALANARAARRSLDAAQKSTDAAQAAFDNADKRLRHGTINNLQLLTARNVLDVAQTDLIVAKYEYLFRLKLIDFYLGRELKL